MVFFCLYIDIFNGGVIRCAYPTKVSALNPFARVSIVSRFPSFMSDYSGAIFSRNLVPFPVNLSKNSPHSFLLFFKCHCAKLIFLSVFFRGSGYV